MLFNCDQENDIICQPRLVCKVIISVSKRFDGSVGCLMYEICLIFSYLKPALHHFFCLENNAIWLLVCWQNV
jgi:hypothetical protein